MSQDSHAQKDKRRPDHLGLTLEAMRARDCLHHALLAKWGPHGRAAPMVVVGRCVARVVSVGKQSLFLKLRFPRAAHCGQVFVAGQRAFEAS